MSAEPGRKAHYSSDLRWRMVWQRLAMDLPFCKIARNLNVATGTVHNVFKHFVNTGDVCNKPHKERSSTRALTISEEMFVLGLIMESPCLYLHEVCQQLEEISGFSVSISTICRLLHCHGLSRKKVQKIALERRIDF